MPFIRGIDDHFTLIYFLGNSTSLVNVHGVLWKTSADQHQEQGRSLSLQVI